MSRHDQSGSIAVVQATILLVVVVLGGIATLDVGALLRAARVATAAADGAALAASTASQPVSRTLPRAAAERVARAHGATLDTCDCGGPRAQVAVALPVSTRLLDHFGITEVRASATADLVPLSTPTSNSTVGLACAGAAPVRAAAQPGSGSLVGTLGRRGVVTRTCRVPQSPS